MTPQDVDVVILNYRTAALSAQAARSAKANSAGSIVVVDNGSADDSVERLRGEVGGFAHVLPLPENQGFSAGNNRGAALGKSLLILLMNSDAVMQAGALADLVQVLDIEPRVGVVAPALFDSKGEPQASAYRFITPTVIVQSLFGLDKLSAKLRWTCWSGNVDRKRNGNYTGPVGSLYGPCLLVRRRAFEEVGGFDEDFFLYCEETDLVLRMKQRGWSAYRIASAEVTHHHNQTAGLMPQRSLILMNESHRLYARKHFRAPGRWMTKFAFTLGLALRWLLTFRSQDRQKYKAALGVWWGWTISADPRASRIIANGQSSNSLQR